MLRSWLRKQYCKQGKVAAELLVLRRVSSLKWWAITYFSVVFCFVGYAGFMHATWWRAKGDYRYLFGVPISNHVITKPTLFVCVVCMSSARQRVVTNTFHHEGSVDRMYAANIQNDMHRIHVFNLGLSIHLQGGGRRCTVLKCTSSAQSHGLCYMHVRWLHITTRNVQLTFDLKSIHCREVEDGAA